MFRSRLLFEQIIHFLGSQIKIIKTINNTNKATVSTAELDKLGITSSFNLSITAFNEGTLTNVYWNGRI